VDIEEIREKVKKEEFILSYHAHEERLAESIEIEDIKTALIKGEIIEDYPEDKRGGSCLILGYANVLPIHVVCGKSKTGWLKIITVYIPKPPKWITPKLRSEER
jgi:hypothetical protein